jgi:hypothetical protein
VIALTLPIRTVSESNARGHWATRARRAKPQRRAAGLAVRAVCPPEWVQRRPRPKTASERNLVPAIGEAECHNVSVLLVRVAPRLLDDDNLRGALKAVRDGVADALGTDDRDPRVQWAYTQRQQSKTYAVEIHMKPTTLPEVNRDNTLLQTRNHASFSRHDNCQGGQHAAHSDAEGISSDSPTDLLPDAGRAAACAGREGPRARSHRGVDSRANARITAELSSPMLAGEE